MCHRPRCPDLVNLEFRRTPSRRRFKNFCAGSRSIHCPPVFSAVPTSRVLRSLLGFATLAKGGDAKEADKPKSGSNAPLRSCYFDGGDIHAQDLARCNRIRRFIHIQYWSPRRWYMVRALRHWLGRDELRFLLI